MAALPKKKLCFVVGPIGEEGTEIRAHADWVLKGIIRPVLDSHPEFEVKRADHDPRPGLIDVQLIADLLDAELVIADLSFLNPNAFYEIGIRHMVQKPIIHLQRMSEKTPFDLSLYRAVKFSRDRYDDLEKAKEDLGRALEAVLAEGYQVENPVTRARGQLQLRQNATPEMQLVMDELAELRNRVSTVEALTFTPPVPVILPRGLGMVDPQKSGRGSGYGMVDPQSPGSDREGHRP